MNATHRGIERRNKPSGWLPHLDSARPTNVFVRLAIRDENELAVVEILKQIVHEGAVSGDCERQPHSLLAIWEQSSCPASVRHCMRDAAGESRCEDYV